MPTCSRIVSALCSSSSRPSSRHELERRDRRVRNGVALACRRRRAGVRRAVAASTAAARSTVSLSVSASVMSATPLPSASSATPTPGRRMRSNRVLGRSRPRARCGVGAVACGNAIAATNSSWKRGSVAVSILTTSRTRPAPSRRAASRDSSACTAPVPAALPTARTRVERAVGNQTEHHRVQRIDMGAERTGEPDVVDRRDAGVFDQQVDTGPQRRLGQLDRPHVVLGDRDRGRSPRRTARSENVRPSATTRGVRSASSPRIDAVGGR